MSHTKAAYQLTPVQSTASPAEWKGTEQITNSIQDGYVILWQYHGVFVGEIKNKILRWLNETQPEMEAKHLVRLRAFDEQKEYHFWRSGKTIKGRLRKDDSGEKSEVVETAMVLRGVVAAPLKQLDGFQAGTLCIKTRNYIGYGSQLPQAGYVDSRFVSIVKPENQNK